MDHGFWLSSYPHLGDRQNAKIFFAARPFYIDSIAYNRKNVVVKSRLYEKLRARLVRADPEIVILEAYHTCTAE